MSSGALDSEDVAESSVDSGEIACITPAPINGIHISQAVETVNLVTSHVLLGQPHCLDSLANSVSWTRERILCKGDIHNPVIGAFHNPNVYPHMKVRVVHATADPSGELDEIICVDDNIALVEHRDGTGGSGSGKLGGSRGDSSRKRIDISERASKSWEDSGGVEAWER